MIKSGTSKIKATTNPNISDDNIKLRATSFVINNKWVNFSGLFFKISDYINNAVRSPRTRFFSDRGYAVYLLVGFDENTGVSVLEGTQVKFTTIDAVPPPISFEFLPLIGVVLIQDGSSDLNFGYIPLSDDNVMFFSGLGNIIDKDLQGITGSSNPQIGVTGQEGITGFLGLIGAYGGTGYIGSTGITPPAQTGQTGLQGMTGINWDIHIPFQNFF